MKILRFLDLAIFACGVLAIGQVIFDIGKTSEPTVYTWHDPIMVVVFFYFGHCFFVSIKNIIKNTYD